MKYDVICVGSALLDIYLKSDKFVKVPTGDVVGGVALCKEFGGKTEVEEVEITSGGGGSNTAVSFARKGFRVALVSEVGTDLVASTIKEELIQEGVDISFMVEEKDEDTGISSIMVASDGGRSVSVYRGASGMLTKEDIKWDSLRSDWLYISSLGGEMLLLEGLIGHAKAYGIKVAVNPGKRELEKISEWGGWQLFEGVEVLLLNREEAKQLSGMDLADEKVWKSEWCIEGPRISVVTDGGRGGKVCSEGECRYYEVDAVGVVEETGAGDAFGSGFVAALMRGRDVGVAIEWGKKQAASVVGYMGAKKGLLRLKEIEG